MILLFFKQYFLKSSKNSLIRVICRVCFLASALSSLSLILIMNIMSGLQKESQNRFLKSEAHLSIPKISESEFKVKVDKLFSGEKIPFSWNAYKSDQLVIEEVSGNFSPLVLKGLPSKVLKERFSHLVSSSKQDKKGLWLDSSLADKLNLFEKDSVLIAPVWNLLINYEDWEFKDISVAKIFQGEQSDFFTAYYSLEENFFSWTYDSHQETGVEMTLYDTEKIDSLEKKLKAIFPNIVSAKEKNALYFFALKVEKFVIFLVLFLALLITDFSVMTAISLILNEKEKEINLLKVLGLSHKKVTFVFTGVSFLFSFSGLITGGLLGLLISYVLKIYPIEFFPYLYYSSYLPFDISFERNFLILVFFTLLSLCTAILPIYFYSWKPVYYFLRKQRV